MGKVFDGETAIKIYKFLYIKPRIILMDHSLPNKSRIETAIVIFQIHNQVKNIFIIAEKKLRKRR